MRRTQPQDTTTTETEITAGSQVAEDQSFFERLAGCTPAEWRSLKVYVYRCWPVIDRKEGQHFIAKVSEPFDEDYLLRTFGSGKYYLRLNDSKGRTLASATVPVHNLDFPPKVHPDEVVASDPQNERYFKVWSTMPSAAAAPSPTNDPATRPEAEVAVKHLGLIAEKLIERAGKETPKENRLDTELVNLFTSTAQQRDELAKKLSAGTSSGTDQLSVVKEVLGLVRELQPASTPQKSALETVKELAEVMTAMRELATPTPPSAGPAEAPSILNTLIQAVGPSVGPVLGQLAQVLLLRAMPAQPTGAPALAVSPLTHAPTSPVPAASASSVPPAQSPAADDGFLRGQILEQVGPFLVNAIAQGETGDGFAHSIVTLYGPQGGLLYNQIAAMGKDGIMQALQSTPSVWSQLAPIRPKVERFVDEFLSYGEDADDDEEESQQGPELAGLAATL